MPHILILGDGPYAQELEEYAKIYLKNVSVAAYKPYVDLAVYEKYYKYLDKIIIQRINQKNMSTYYDLTSGKESPDLVLTYLGAGKSEIRRRMLSESKGSFGIPIKMGCQLGGSMGCGSVLAPSCFVSIGCTIGRHVLINYCASVGHHTTIEDLVTISPNASIGGNCTIKEGAYIGAGANIREGLTIGQNAIVGMGAVVTKDVQPSETVVGIPAKPVNRMGGW